MRALLLVGLGALALAAPAGADPAGGNSFAAGSGKFTTTTAAGGVATAMAFSVAAHETNAGVRGNVNYRGVDFTGVELNGEARVVCFGVLGNRALVLAEFQGESPFGSAHPFALLFLEDNGQPGDPVPDRALAMGTGAGIQAGPPPCPFPADTFAAFALLALPIEQGNVVVHDAAP